MNTSRFRWSLACAAVLFLAGCAEKQQYEIVEQICSPNLSRQQAMQIAEDVLTGINFTIDKADANEGLVTTKPMSAAQFFEFWRSDNVGKFNSAEANLHTIRRTAALTLQQQGQELCIDCDVKIERLNLPERQVTSSTRAYSLFSSSNEAIQRLEIEGEQRKGMAWIDLGRDNRLSTKILRRIQNQIPIQQKGTSR